MTKPKNPIKKRLFVDNKYPTLPDQVEPKNERTKKFKKKVEIFGKLF
jgi:hypothetical protein